MTCSKCNKEFELQSSTIKDSKTLSLITYFVNPYNYCINCLMNLKLELENTAEDWLNKNR